MLLKKDVPNFNVQYINATKKKNKLKNSFKQK